MSAHKRQSPAVSNSANGAPRSSVPEGSVMIGRLDPGLVGTEVSGNLAFGPSPSGRIETGLPILEGRVVVAGTIEQLGIAHQSMVKQQAVRHVAFGLWVVLTTPDPDRVTAGTRRQLHMTPGESPLVVVGVEHAGITARLQVGRARRTLRLVLGLLQ